MQNKRFANIDLEEWEKSKQNPTIFRGGTFISSLGIYWDLSNEVMTGMSIQYPIMYDRSNYICELVTCSLVTMVTCHIPQSSNSTGVLLEAPLISQDTLMQNTSNSWQESTVKNFDCTHLSWRENLSCPKLHQSTPPNTDKNLSK